MTLAPPLIHTPQRFCVAQSAMLSACYPLAEWRTAWKERSQNAPIFFDALEERSGVNRFSYREAQKVAKNFSANLYERSQRNPSI